MKKFLPVLLLIAATQVAAESVPAQQIVKKAEADCRAQQGKFRAGKKAVTRHTFSRGAKPVEIVDGAKFSCSTAASLWGGTGGTRLWVVAGGQVHDLLAHGWRVADFGAAKALVLAVHHSQCGQPGAPCFRALTITADGALRTTTGAP